MKIDNHIHAASAMTEVEYWRLSEAIKLLRQVQARNLIRKFAERDWDRPVLDRDGQEITLGQLLEEKGFERGECGSIDKVHGNAHCVVSDKVHYITADRLSHAADATMFHRFDNFNDSYNPMGDADMRTVFMKTANKTGGDYFAASLKEMVFQNLLNQREHGSTVGIEPRLSIYGRSMKEWRDLAKWWVQNRMLHTGEDESVYGHVRWVIQLPRLFGLWVSIGFCQSFQDYLANVFEPMFEATLHPDKPENRDLAIFL